jgi:pimeloyl-ACP methyl ester carboxylesterase
MMAATSLDGFSAAASALRSYDFRHVLARITVPVLGLAGEADGAMPQTVRTLCETVAHGRFQAIPKAGHVPCFEQPQAVTTAIEEFLDTQSWSAT